MSNSKGLTLIELLVTLAIISAFSGLAATGFVRSYHKKTVQSFKDSLNSAYAYARESAMIRNREYRVVFDFFRQSYWVEKGEPGGEFAKLEGLLGKRHKFPKGSRLDSFNSQKNWIDFYPDGSTSDFQLLWQLRSSSIEIKTSTQGGQIEYIE